jgi:hypothetical protein
MKYTLILICSLLLPIIGLCQEPWNTVKTFDPSDSEKIKEVEKALKELLQIKQSIEGPSAVYDPTTNKYLRVQSKTTRVDGCILGNCIENGIFYENGSYYSGAFGDNYWIKPSPVYKGFSKRLFPDNSFYLGEFNSKNPNGVGIMVYHSEYYYIGQWYDGAWNGKGKRVHFGEITEGSWDHNILRERANNVIDCSFSKIFTATLSS